MDNLTCLACAKTGTRASSTNLTGMVRCSLCGGLYCSSPCYAEADHRMPVTVKRRWTLGSALRRLRGAA